MSLAAQCGAVRAGAESFSEEVGVGDAQKSPFLGQSRFGMLGWHCLGALGPLGNCW